MWFRQRLWSYDLMALYKQFIIIIIIKSSRCHVGGIPRCSGVKTRMLTTTWCGIGPNQHTVIEIYGLREPWHKEFSDFRLSLFVHILSVYLQHGGGAVLCPAQWHHRTSYRVSYSDSVSVTTEHHPRRRQHGHTARADNSVSKRRNKKMATDRSFNLTTKIITRAPPVKLWLLTRHRFSLSRHLDHHFVVHCCVSHTARRPDVSTRVHNNSQATLEFTTCAYRLSLSWPIYRRSIACTHTHTYTHTLHWRPIHRMTVRNQ